jgi:hypothetical protein
MMFLRSIKNIAGDCNKTHRWALVNLTGDDGNDNKREKLSTLRIVKVGTKYVSVMQANGLVLQVQPRLIAKVW